MDRESMTVADYEARALAEKAMALMEAHERECSALRRSQEQWQHSAARLIEDIRNMIKEHTEKDSEVQGKIFAKLDGWSTWIITIMVSVIGGLLAVIGALVWHFVIK